MSQSTPIPQALGTPNTAGQPTTPADQAVSVARDLPDLIQKAATLDPELAAKFTGQALIASRSPWGSLAGGIVTWLVSKYGLGWPPEVCDLVAGAGVLVASYAMRVLTEHPITGWFQAATPAQAAAKAGAK